MDEEFYGQFAGYLNQFSCLLDSIFSLLIDYIDYTERTAVGSNLLDQRFANLNTLKCETLYLLGIVLLLVEAKFPALIKERIFVALYRTRFVDEGLNKKYYIFSLNFATRKFELLVSVLRNRKENFESCFQ